MKFFLKDHFMNHTKDSLHKIIHDRLLANVLDGVGHFPKPLMPTIASDSSESQNKLSIQQRIQQCQLCPLAFKRNNALVAQVIEQRKFFILAEFPDTIEDQSAEVFSTKSTYSNLILNLLGKMGILEQSYFSYSIKCSPEKELPENSLKTCATNHLIAELKLVAPEYIFCFGYRALKAFMLCVQEPVSELKYNENSVLDKMRIFDKPLQPYFFSSIRDLHQFPHWRKQVWELLATL